MAEQAPASSKSFLPIVLEGFGRKRSGSMSPNSKRRARSRSRSSGGGGGGGVSLNISSSNVSTDDDGDHELKHSATPTVMESKARSVNGTTAQAPRRCETERRQFNVLYAVFISSFAICMVCLGILGTLVTQNQISNGAMDTTSTDERGLLHGWRNNRVLNKLGHLSEWFKPVDYSAVRKQEIKKQLEEISQLECIGWRQTRNCTPLGMREAKNDHDCQTMIDNGASGFCEVQHKATGEIKQVMKMHCDSLRPGVQFSCEMFPRILSYHLLSTEYEHDANFTFEKAQDELRQENTLAVTLPMGDDGIKKGQAVGQLDLSFDRAILMVIYERLLLGAFVSIRSLRNMGCTLPIEMWYRTSETDVNHPLLRVLTAEYGVYLREIKDDRADGFYTKLHAIFYSAFDNVLLLDADNFAAQDPNYLFETPEFVKKGAIFWPDFWKPGNTIFNIHATSFVWDYFGLTYVDQFEQESGQVLINRRMHMKALNVLMYYGFTQPRMHEDLRLVWGDKDLFRFAWMKSESPFHYIERPAGSAGTKHPEYDLFCGVTMVQHDPAGKVLFLHRNTEKLVPDNDRLVWTHIQQFKRTSAYEDYYVRGANGGKVFPQFKRCFGKDVHYDKLFTLKPMSAFPFENLEKDLKRFMAEGAAILNITTTAVSDPPPTHPDDP